MEIRYDRDAAKYLMKLPSNTKKSIMDAINGLTEHPPRGDIKPMQGYKDGRYRLRVGKYRVIYRYSTENTLKILLILEIGSRGDIYKKI